MDDLISRSAVKEDIGSYAGMFTDELGFVVSMEAVLRGIDFAESVDAVEVVHGEWKTGYPITCSVCGGYAATEYEDANIYEAWLSPYCPNCGADMRKRREND